MDRGTLIRSHRLADLGNILHSRHQYHWHTGYVPPQTVAAPHLGAVLARTLGPRNPDMPAFIDIGQNLEIGAESDELKAFHTAGFLGSEYGPFGIMDPEDAVGQRASAGGHDRHALRRSLQGVSRAGGGQPGDADGQRLPARVAAALDGECAPPADLAGRQGVRSLARAEEELRHLQHRPFRPGLPAGAAADRSRRALHRGHHRVHSVPLLGHARERPRARGGDEGADRPADRAAGPATWKSADCSTAR